MHFVFIWTHFNYLQEGEHFVKTEIYFYEIELYVAFLPNIIICCD